MWFRLAAVHLSDGRYDGGRAQSASHGQYLDDLWSLLKFPRDWKLCLDPIWLAHLCFKYDSKVVWELVN